MTEGGGEGYGKVFKRYPRDVRENALIIAEMSRDEAGGRL